MATEAETWRQCFQHWPADLARRGVLVTSFDEQIPFEGFATSDELLLVERRAPDTVGGRTVLLAYQQIKALKFVDVVKVKAFQSLGLTAPPPRKPA
jgi:hypothetical protein